MILIVLARVTITNRAIITKKMETASSTRVLSGYLVLREYHGGRPVDLQYCDLGARLQLDARVVRTRRPDLARELDTPAGPADPGDHDRVLPDQRSRPGGQLGTPVHAANDARTHEVQHRYRRHDRKIG